MSKRNNNVNDLLAAIKRTPTAPQETISKEGRQHETPEVVPPHVKSSERRAAKKAPKSRVGKAVQFWMHDEDRKLVRELAAWLAGQGARPTDSMVIRAALRFAKTGSGFLEAYRQAGQLDGRYKRD
jgi:hypothetical protein